MMDKTKGVANEIIGSAQDAVGYVTHDPKTQLEGRVRRASGKLQSSYGEALNGFREAAINNPAETLAVVAGVSFLLGMLWARRD